MSEPRLLVTPRFTAYAGDSYRHRASLAVRVLDDFTGSAPSVSVRVRLKTDRFLNAIRNHSGEYCFRDIHDGQHTLLIEPDPLLDYFYLKPLPQKPWPGNFEVSVILPLLDSPLLEVRLVPNPSYPFSQSATLIRGKVVRGEKKEEVPRAIVRTSYEQFSTGDVTKRISIETLTDSKGHFVLFFLSLPKKTQRVDLHAELNGQASGPKRVTIRERFTQKTVLTFS